MNIKESISLLIFCFVLRNADHAKADIVDVIGGSAGDITNFPYQVSLRFNKQFICGGIIIDNRHILTAAHCVCADDYSSCPVPANELTIVAGSSTINPIGKGGVQVAVEKIFVHENYVSKRIYANDIAVLRLSKVLKFGKGIQACPLTESTPRDGTECIVSGWGMTAKTGNHSNVLMHANLTVIGHNACAAINNVLQTVICTDRGGKKPFFGDSGGPLNCGGKIAGIVSTVYLFDIFPNHFTDIAQYKSWIDIQLKRETSTTVKLNVPYYIFVLISQFVYSFVRRLLFIVTIPFTVIINIIRSIFPWLFQY